MTKQTAEVAVINQGFQFPVLSAEMREAIAEEMDGLTFEFDKIKIPSGGGIAFEVPGDDPESPDIEKELYGVIVDQHAANGLWEGEYTGEKAPPVCFSVDAKIGIDMKTGEEKSCQTCEWNQFGTGKDGIGKACKNMQFIYLLREGDTYPLLLQLPPTSRKAFNSYMTKRLIGRGLLSSYVVTKITLKKATNTGGIAYSEAQFAVDRVLSDEDKAVSAEYAKGIKAITRQQPSIQTVNTFDDLARGSQDDVF